MTYAGGVGHLNQPKVELAREILRNQLKLDERCRVLNRLLLTKCVLPLTCLQPSLTTFNINNILN